MGILFDKLKQIELMDGGGGCDLNFFEPRRTQATATPTTTTTNAADNSCNSNGNGNATRRKKYNANSVVTFPDLDTMPPELSLQILKHLNATDLCLAACVWSSLANDDILWQSLCKSTWAYASCYHRRLAVDDRYAASTSASALGTTSGEQQAARNFRKIFMHLDEATLTFNADWRKGLDYLIGERLVDDDAEEIAKFINSTKKLSGEQKAKLFKERKAVLDHVVRLHNYENQFLPVALRRFFAKIEAPKERNSYLSLLLEKFSKRFATCNPQLGLTEDSVYILCFSLILLSVDLFNPAVKNKMSKREFIRNTRHALPYLSADFTGHLYDNVYLNGNISDTKDATAPLAPAATAQSARAASPSRSDNGQLITVR